MSLSITTKPNIYHPSYNPSVYAFSGTNYTKAGYRYIVQVFSAGTSTQLTSNLKVAPEVDGTGYIDISKIISSYVDYDFNPQNTTNFNASNSYVKYDIKLGEEYQNTWTYTRYQNAGGSSIYSGYTLLNQVTSATTHTYAVGDQIDVTTTVTDINGLHTVVGVPSAYSVIIDLPFTASGNTSGTIEYADNRKTQYLNITSSTGFTAFNTALSFKEFPYYRHTNYAMDQNESGYLFMSNIPSTFTITPEQDLYTNILKNLNNTLNLNLKITNSLGDVTINNVWSASTGGNLQAINIGGNSQYLLTGSTTSGTMPLVRDGVEWYEYEILNNSLSAISVTQRIILDNRCKINDWEIAFLDRKGSIGSFAFQLRNEEKIDVKKDTYFQKLGGITNNIFTYNTYDVGETTFNVDLSRSYTLNTNWMNDSSSVYFEELISSPFTCVKIDGYYFSCQVTDNSMVIERQKNKNLIKKTVTIKLSNQEIINI
jgi:hypothetical protein